MYCQKDQLSGHYSLSQFNLKKTIIKNTTFRRLECLSLQVKTYSVGRNPYSPYLRAQGLALSIVPNIVGFYLMKETDSTLRNVVFLIKVFLN
jgi:hypothetical protein